MRKRQILIDTTLYHQHKFIPLPYATQDHFVLAGIISFEISFFFSFSRSFFLTFFSRLRLVRFSRSVSACAVIAAYFLRMAIRRFLPARERRVLVVAGVEARRVGQWLDSDDGLLAFRCMTRHGSAVPGFEPRRMMSAPIIPIVLYCMREGQVRGANPPISSGLRALLPVRLIWRRLYMPSSALGLRHWRNSRFAVGMGPQRRRRRQMLAALEIVY
jgi:hypothetical protein